MLMQEDGNVIGYNPKLYKDIYHQPIWYMDQPFVKNPAEYMQGNRFAARTTNDPFANLAVIYGETLDVLEERFLNAIVDDEEKLQSLQNKLLKRAIELIRGEAKKQEYKEIYVSFEKAANTIVVYVPLNEYTLDDDGRFSAIEKAVQEKIPLFVVEVVPLLDGEFVGKNMIHYEL